MKKTILYICEQKYSCFPSPSQQKIHSYFRDFAFYRNTPLLLPSFPNSHTQCSLSLPKASGLWPTAIHSLLKAMLCMWLLKATLLMPCAPFAVCMHICVLLFVCVCVLSVSLHQCIKRMYMYCMLNVNGPNDLKCRLVNLQIHQHIIYSFTSPTLSNTVMWHIQHHLHVIHTTDSNTWLLSDLM